MMYLSGILHYKTHRTLIKVCQYGLLCIFHIRAAKLHYILLGKGYELDNTECLFP